MLEQQGDVDTRLFLTVGETDRESVLNNLRQGIDISRQLQTVASRASEPPGAVTLPGSGSSLNFSFITHANCMVHKHL